MNPRPTIPLIPDLIDIRLRNRSDRPSIESIEVGHILPFRSIV